MLRLRLLYYQTSVTSDTAPYAVRVYAGGVRTGCRGPRVEGDATGSFVGGVGGFWTSLSRPFPCHTRRPLFKGFLPFLVPQSLSPVPVPKTPYRLQLPGDSSPTSSTVLESCIRCVSSVRCLFYDSSPTPTPYPSTTSRKNQTVTGEGSLPGLPIPVRPLEAVSLVPRYEDG